MKKRERFDRRQFMSAMTGAIAAIISAAMGVPAIAYLIGPSLQSRVENWIRLGSVAKVEIGTPTLFKAKIERRAGWITTNEEIAAYVLTENGREFIAMSNICTHLGCRVRWVADRERFFCPCHNGVFDKQGNVISGPPPRPLDRYEARVDEDQIAIMAG